MKLPLRARLFLVAGAAFVLGSMLTFDRPSPGAVAQARTVTLDGSCDRGDVLVFEGSNRARCVDVDRLAYPRCDSGEFLSTVAGELRCIGPSSTPWGARGLLPECRRGALLLSEGFGRWRCEERH